MWYAVGAGGIAVCAAGVFWLLGRLNATAGEQARRERLARYRDGSL
jgi:hypothetical protein